MTRGRRLLRILSAAAVITAAGAGPAQAVVPTGNLLVNGNAEAGTGATDPTTVSPVPIQGWTTSPNFTEDAYGTNWFPDATQAAAIGGGSQFFAGGPYDGVHDVQTATQNVDVSQASAEVDKGGVLATLSAYLGGYDSQDDQGTVTATFLAGDSRQLGSFTIGPVTTKDRTYTTELLARSAAGAVPPGTRTIRVVMTAYYHEGSYNDAYFDNVSLGLVPPPVLGQSVDVGVATGTVMIKPPGGGAFQTLQGGARIPLGSTVDATRGAVELTSAKNRKGAMARGRFHSGTFRVTQVALHRTALTVLTLAGPKPAACFRRHGPIARLRGRPKQRSLWGTASGNYSTQGSYASATERGTKWLTRDTCAGTLIMVLRGAVTVHDFPHHRTFVLTAHHSFLAHPGKGG